MELLGLASEGVCALGNQLRCTSGSAVFSEASEKQVGLAAFGNLGAVGLLPVFS